MRFHSFNQVLIGLQWGYIYDLTEVSYGYNKVSVRFYN